MDVTYKSHEKFVYPPARYQYKDATPRHLAGSLSRLNPDIQISGNALTVHCTSGACLDAYEGERIATTQVTGASELTLRLCSEEEAKKVMSALRTLILKNGGKTARY